MKLVKTVAVLAVMHLFVFFATMGGVSLLAAPAAAEDCAPDCNQPTGVGKGQKVPVWHVVDCVIGPEGGPYTVVDCKNPVAVHLSPRGKPVVCFIGSDNKIHWDRQENVRIGRPFINQKINGVWYINWQ